LEARRLLAAIYWQNEADASDGFNATFGGQANDARAAVNAAIDAWERVIVDFNYQPGTTGGTEIANTFSITIQMGSAASLVGVQWTHDVSQNGVIEGTEVDSTGKPRSGLLTLSDPGQTPQHPGWYLDSSPDESSEYDGDILNAFSARGPSSGPAALPDLYSYAVMGIGSLLGIAETSQIAGNNLAIEGSPYVTPTTAADQVDFGGNGRLWKFESPNVRALLSSHSASTNPAFIARPGQNSVVPGFHGAVDSQNATLDDPVRTLPSNLAALILQDTYGYTIKQPEEFGTFYAHVTQPNNTLKVRGSVGSDIVRVTRVGNEMVVSVDVRPDVPGTGPTDAFESRFAVSRTGNIDIDTGDHLDFIYVESTGIAQTTSIDSGSTNDFVFLGNSIQGMDLIENVVNVVGSGNDDLILNDASSRTHTAYTITEEHVELSGNREVNFSDIRTLSLTGSQGSNLIKLDTNVSYVTVDAGPGDDRFIVTPHSDVYMQLSGRDGTDKLSMADGYNDWHTNSGGGQVTTKNRSRSWTGFSSVEILEGGRDRDRFYVNPGAPEGWLSIDGRDGTDTLDFSGFDSGVYVDLERGVSETIPQEGKPHTWDTAGFEIVMGSRYSDALIGDKHGNVLVGNRGDDILEGRDGRDILIGGQGRDHLYGDGGDDVLVAPYTVYDSRDEELTSLRKVWMNKDESFRDRIRGLQLNPATGVGLNLRTVFDDDVTDELFGDAGLEWFISATNDRVWHKDPDDVLGLF